MRLKYESASGGRLGSHLFVSSKNASAVRCYQKFGYSKSLRPSGDAAHGAPSPVFGG